MTVDWLGPGRGGLPPSVGTEHLIGAQVWARRQPCIHAVGNVRVAAWQDHRCDHQRNASPRKEIQLPHHVWADGSKGPAKLAVDNYAYGTHARLNSWVILVPAADLYLWVKTIQHTPTAPSVARLWCPGTNGKGISLGSVRYYGIACAQYSVYLVCNYSCNVITL